MMPTALAAMLSTIESAMNYSLHIYFVEACVC